MAIGATTAILGSAALGAGASIAANRSNANAINRAADAQQQSTDQAVASQERMFNRQVELAEPFRQFGVQQANALGELFGFDPVGGQGSAGGANPSVPAPVIGTPSAQDNRIAQGEAYLAANPDLAAEAQRQARFGFRPDGVPASYDFNGDGIVQGGEYATLHADRFGRFESRPMLPGEQPPAATNPGNVDAVIPSSGTDGAAASGINADAQEQARQRFEGSLFSDALQGALGRVATGVDANFAASGQVYSGAREQAQQNAAADLGLNALGMYTNTMLGQPSTAGAQLASNAAGQFGANSANLALQQGQNQANSAFLGAQNNNALLNNLVQLGGFGLGAFTGQGGGAPTAGGFNFGYNAGPTMFTG